MVMTLGAVDSVLPWRPDRLAATHIKRVYTRLNSSPLVVEFFGLEEFVYRCRNSGVG